MFRIIVGVLSLPVAVWQFYSSYKEFHRIKSEGNRNTSAFAPYGIYFGFFFGFLILVLGIALLLNTL